MSSAHHARASATTWWAAREPNDGQRHCSLIDTITARLDPDARFGDVRDQVESTLLSDELPRAAAGLCVEQTVYGMLGTTYCEQPAAAGALLCQRHRREHIEQHGPHPRRGAFLDDRNE